MSYKTWSVDGFGINISKVINKMDTKAFEIFKANARAYVDGDLSTTLRTNGDDVIIKAYFDTPSTGDTESDKVKMIEAFSSYETEYGLTGLDAFMSELFTWMYKSAGHDANIIHVVQDDFGDGSIYWLLGTVFPWYRGERFDSEDAAIKALTDSFNGMIAKNDIDYEEIEQGG